MSRAICSRIPRALYWIVTSSSPEFGGPTVRRALITTWATGKFQLFHRTDASHRALLSFPWAATQLRQARFSGADVISTSIVLVNLISYVWKHISFCKYIILGVTFYFAKEFTNYLPHCKTLLNLFGFLYWLIYSVLLRVLLVASIHWVQNFWIFFLQVRPGNVIERKGAIFNIPFICYWFEYCTHTYKEFHFGYLMQLMWSRKDLPGKQCAFRTIVIELEWFCLVTPSLV